jgi:hypothetical protein
MFMNHSQTISQLANQLSVGDLVFIRVPTPLFMQVADATGSWTNHVGVVIDAAATVAESRVPLSGMTSLRSFVRRSTGGRVAVARMRRPLGEVERQRVAVAARRRTGILYDTGFNLWSRRQFCSRFSREVIGEATGEPGNETAESHLHDGATVRRAHPHGRRHESDDVRDGVNTEPGRDRLRLSGATGVTLQLRLSGRSDL